MSNTNGTNDGDDDGEPSINLTSTVTIGSAKEPTKEENDDFTRQVEQIMAREKENKATVRRLREMVLRGRKRIIELKLAIKSKERGSGDLARQNQQVDKVVKSAVQELKKMTPKTEEDECDGKCGQEPELRQLLEKLKNASNDLSNDVKQKEELLKKCPPPVRDRRNEELPMLEEKEHELADAKSQLDDLLQIEKKWLQKLAHILRHEKNMEKEKFATFLDGIHRIIELIDSCLAAELENDKLEEQRDKLEKRKNELHSKVEKRFQERKPLEFLPNKIRREYEQIARKRENTQPLPETSPDLVVHLQELYKWGLKELAQGERELKECNREAKDAKEKGDHNEKMRQIHKQAKDEEIQTDGHQLAKLQTENKQLRAQVEKANVAAGAKNAKTIEICKEIRTVIETNQTQSISVIKTRTKMESDIEVENEKGRLLQETIDQLRKQKSRQEEELKQLKREIHQQSIINAERNRDDQARRKKMEQRLEANRRDKENLKEDRKQQKRSPC